jgi:methionyl-tRNA formyltransferase
MTATEIFNRLRGFTPFPGCYTFFNGHRLEIVESRAEPREASVDKFEPGEVCEVMKDSFVVACGGALALRVTAVHLEGKRAMSARDFLNGARLQVGAKLGRRIEY